MVDITVLLSLQGRARRNAKASMLRLRQARADATEAAAAIAGAQRAETHDAAEPVLAGAEHRAGSTDGANLGHLDPDSPEWAALAASCRDPQVDQRALLSELLMQLRSPDVVVRDERRAQEMSPGPSGPA